MNFLANKTTPKHYTNKIVWQFWLEHKRSVWTTCSCL